MERWKRIVSTEPSQWIAALQGSHARLRSLVEPMDSERLEGQSYASEWSIAQVLSHLGSGAEIFDLFLDAALTGSELPGREQFAPIWEKWNAKSPEAQASDGLERDGAYVERFSSLEPAQRDELHLSLFGMELDAIGLMRMRLGEHSVHTWDVAVAVDDTATVSPDAVALLVDTLGPLVARSGKPTGGPLKVSIHTTDPEREFVLSIGDSVSLTEADGDVDLPELRIPAEALLRLVYGRLDPDHSPQLEASAVDLAVLRSVFPGI
jgi:uncharacterized protein (TIGR03083 family)